MILRFSKENVRASEYVSERKRGRENVCVRVREGRVWSGRFRIRLEGVVVEVVIRRKKRKRGRRPWISKRKQVIMTRPACFWHRQD